MNALSLYLTTLALVACAHASLDCNDACNLLSPSSEETSMFYKLTTRSLDDGSVSVSVDGYNSSFLFRGLVLQVFSVGEALTGGFVADGKVPTSWLQKCGGSDLYNTLCVHGDEPIDEVDVDWAPSGSGPEVEVKALYLDLDDNVHLHHSMIVDLKVPQVEGENNDLNLHDDRDESEAAAMFMEKQLQEIEIENLNTEDGLAGEEEEERRQHEQEIRWEETLYEIEQKAEEDARRARMQAEIRDKEEYDRQQYEKEREEEERRRQEEEEEARRRKEEEDRNRNRVPIIVEEEIDIIEPDNRIADGMDNKGTVVSLTSLVSLLVTALLVLFF